MNTIDRIILTVAIAATCFATHLAAYEFGQRSECRKQGNYWSMDYGECVEKMDKK